MKKLKLIILTVLMLSATMVFAAPSLQITSPPVTNNGWTGPIIDPPASQGQWFLRLPDGIEEVRTHEFYDNVNPEHGGGTSSHLAIKGVVQTILYVAGPGTPITYFEVLATITNDTPALSPWSDGTNSHEEMLLATEEQYVGTLYDTKLTTEFAIEQNSFNHWLATGGTMPPPYRDTVPHIVAIEPNQLGWYCWTPENESQFTPYGDYLVPTYDFGDIVQGASVSRILKFTVDGGGLPSTDPRYSVLVDSEEFGLDIFLNRTTSLKISTWIDDIYFDTGVPYPQENPLRGSDVSVFHNIQGEDDPKWEQLPDLSITGIDVMATEPFILADDFECNETGLITEITVWGSWNDDYRPGIEVPDANLVEFTLSIHRDITAQQNPDGYSKPGVVDWYRNFVPGEFTVVIEKDNIEEGWLRPDDPASYVFPADTVCWKYTFTIPPEEAFCQQGTPEEPIVYWLDVQARPQPGSEPNPPEFGWKTSLDHWNDDAVWGMGIEPYTGFWNELIYPPMHEMAEQSIDLAFAINGDIPCTGEPKNDLGDAPDSTNNAGVAMTASYTTAAPGNFPTVYLSAGSPPYGPIHIQPTAAFHLGVAVSLENEADIGLDQDATNNILPASNTADFDDADDGVASTLPLPRCRMVKFNYDVMVIDTSVPIYANVWFDWNRDGDWDDTLMCDLSKPANEWAVKDQTLSFTSTGLQTVSTPVFRTFHDNTADHIWMRITLSDVPYTPSGTGGSGPSGGYLYGETEDYYLVPDTSCNNCADFDLSGQIDWLDLKELVDSWLWITNGFDYREADLDCDGDIQFDDFAILAQQWMLSCP